MIRIISFTLIIFSLIIFPYHGSSYARTIHLSKTGGDFSSIQEALDSAAPGDTIIVEKGIYHGNIVIEKKGIKLIGKDDPVIQGEKFGTVVLLKGDDCLIRGFTIKGGGGDLAKNDSGLMFRDCKNSVVEDCRFFDNGFGCYFYRADHCIFRNNLIHGRVYEVEEERKRGSLYECLDTGGEAGNGIHLWDSAYYLIEGNEIRYGRDGIYISFSNLGVIKNNWIHHTRYGLHYMYSKENAFEENILTDNVAGAAVMYSQHMKWNRNVFAHNRGFRAYGILWQDVRHSECLENLVIDNSIGLYFDQAGYSTVKGNMVIWNDIAVVLLENSELNTVYENNFIKNISNVQLRGGTQKGRNNSFYKDGRGNYWDDYQGFDLDSDGVGDNHHVLQNIYEYILAEEPTYQLFLFSPAAQAIALAEKVFPIIKVSHEAIDKYPLMRAVEISALKELFTKLKKIDEKKVDIVGHGRLWLKAFSIFFGGLSILTLLKFNKMISLWPWLRSKI